MKLVKVKKIAPESFQKFGQVTSTPETKPAVSNSSVDYWHAVNNLSQLGEEAITGYALVKPREFVLDKMERHCRSLEGFSLLTGGPAVLALAPAGNNEAPNDTPDPDQIEAFLLDKSQAVTINEGVWHWAPFPIGGPATILLWLRRSTLPGDIDYKELDERVGFLF